jgi:hypothetical protein
VPTLIHLERGDPGAGTGFVATALWLVGRVAALGELADPRHDRGALELDLREATRRRAVRSAASVRARLASAAKKAKAAARR